MGRLWFDEEKTSVDRCGGLRHYTVSAVIQFTAYNTHVLSIDMCSTQAPRIALAYRSMLITPRQCHSNLALVALVTRGLSVSFVRVRRQVLRCR